jgi:cytochrome P450
MALLRSGLITLSPHPEEQHSCASKDRPVLSGTSFETALSRLLRMRSVVGSTYRQAAE